MQTSKERGAAGNVPPIPDVVTRHDAGILHPEAGLAPRWPDQRMQRGGGPSGVIIAFLLGQRYFVAGITSGAVKE